MNAITLTVDSLVLQDLVPLASLEEARAFRDDLGRLLRRERLAAADFLVALADFDRRRGWERLGHASLFSFLTRELGLSKGAAYVRLSGARLIPAFPAVEAALRDGRLCLSAVGELARVITPENQADVLPRFLGCSSREARDVVAALAPRAVAPRRDVVTAMGTDAAATTPLQAPVKSETSVPVVLTSAPAEPARILVRAHEPTLTRPARALPLDDAEPLGADLRRLHVTVSRRLLEKLDRARSGLSHALPCATTEQVLEAALDLLLEKQARAKALVKRPRPARARSPDPRAIPAAVEREVRLRDGDRCAFPLDAGGPCGSTWQVELDHVVPVALGGQATASNLRCACRRHNRLAAEEALGERARARRLAQPGPDAVSRAASSVSDAT